MNLSDGQRKTLSRALIVVALMIAFPPWFGNYSGKATDRVRNYRPLLWGNFTSDEWIDTGTLCWQILGVGALTAALLLRRSTKGERSADQKGTPPTRSKGTENDP